MDFVNLVNPVLNLFRQNITVFGVSFSFWGLLLWMLGAGLVIDFIKGVFLDGE